MSRVKEIYYPESDGKPMAESDLHRDWMVTIIERLKGRYRGKRVYVSGNLLIYYVEGNANKCIAPDVFVVKRCDSRRRRIFKTWIEGRVPSWIMETTSKQTKREDSGPKMEIYAKLSVNEYFLYDPEGEWVDPPLKGFRLAHGKYEPIVPEKDGRIFSKELSINFILEDSQLVMYDAKTAEPILSDRERAEQAERRIAEFEQELGRLQRRQTNGRNGSGTEGKS